MKHVFPQNVEQNRKRDKRELLKTLILSKIECFFYKFNFLNWFLLFFAIGLAFCLLGFI